MSTHYRPFRERKKGYIRFCLQFVLLLLAAAVFYPVLLATSYRITDGSRIYTYTGFPRSPGKVLAASGLELWDADSFRVETTESGGEIIVDRAQRITVNYYGETQIVTSAGETVGALLSRMGLEIEESDLVTPELTAQTCSGMEITVARITRQQETYTSQVPYRTLLYNAAQLPSGVREVLIPGEDGEVLRTAEVTYANGREIRREILAEKFLSAPVAEIMAVGTGSEIGKIDPEGTPVIGENTITLPTGEVLTYTKTDLIRATAYTHTDAGCNMTTATGTKVRRGTVAVDPRYIPYGTRMFIMAEDGSYVYGVAEAEDCGGDIKGDRMDLYMPTLEECLAFGRRRCILYFLG